MGSPTENQDVAGLHKTPTGIEGFDLITGGGLPLNRTTLLLGGPGSGKTVFALQTLVNGARQFGEPGIFVAFEENSRHILANAASFGWNLPELEKKQLLFVDAKMRPDVIKAGEFDLSGMLAGIKAEADARGARRIVFDSIDVLLTLLDDRSAERREIYRLDDWLSESGLTGIITSKSQGDDPFVGEGYGFMQFMADCVAALKLRVVDQIALRHVQVMKYRGSSFAENEAPLVIGASGMEVADISATTVAPETSQARVSSGVERLDAILGSGYFRGFWCSWSFRSDYLFRAFKPNQQPSSRPMKQQRTLANTTWKSNFHFLREVRQIPEITKVIPEAELVKLCSIQQHFNSDG